MIIGYFMSIVNHYAYSAAKMAAVKKREYISWNTYRVPDAICRPLEVHVDATCPKLTRRKLKLENLCGLGPENLTTLLSSVLVGVTFVRWRRGPAALLLGCPGRGNFLKMVYVCLDVVNVAEDRPPVSGQFL